MGTKKFCDRCDSVTDVLIEVSIPNVSDQPSRTIELCKRCIWLLHDWVAPVPHVKEGYA